MEPMYSNNPHRLELYKRSSASFSAFVDFLLIDRKKEIYAISVAGQDKFIEGFVEYMQEGRIGRLVGVKGQDVRFNQAMSPFTFRKNYYDEETTKFDDVTHSLLISKQIASDVKAKSDYDLEVRNAISGNRPVPARTNDLFDLILAWDGELEKEVYKILDDRYNTPMLPEWSSYIYQELINLRRLEILTTYSFVQQNPIVGGILNLTEEQLESIITEGIQSFQLEFAIFEDNEAEDVLSASTDIQTYLTNFGGELGKLIQENVKVDFDPAVDTHHPVFNELNLHANNNGVTGFYPPQANTIMGVARTLLRDDFCFVIGEMGSGKTSMGSAIPHVTEAILQGKDANLDPYRSIIMVPSIVAYKWKREIEERVPGAQVTIIQNWLDLKKLHDESSYITDNGKRRFRKPEKVEFYIMSSELPKQTLPTEPIKDWRMSPTEAVMNQSKFRFGKKTVYDPDQNKHVEIVQAQETGYYCPKCGNPIKKKDDYVGENFFDAFNRKSGTFKKNKKAENTFCKSMVSTDRLPKEEIREWEYSQAKGRYVPAKAKQTCNFNFWQLEKNLSAGKRKMSPAWYINKQFPRGFFKYLIADEVHEYKSGQSSIGQALGQLINHTEKQILLTGTLFGGMSRDIFYLLARLNPKGLQREAIGYKDEALFNARYGVNETTRSVVNERLKLNRQPKPGISPHLFPMYLMGNATFLELNDMGYALPPYEEIPKIIQMDPDHKESYDNFSHDFMETASGIDSLKGMASVSNYINTMYQYADAPFDFGNVGTYDQAGAYHYLATADDFDKTEFEPAKFRELLSILTEEVEQHGRKNLVYVKYTGEGSYNRMDTLLYDQLKARGFKVGILTNQTTYDGIKMPKSSTDREEWLEAMMEKHDWDVLITNPKLVKVGLDLIMFPNIHFYQLDYSTYDYMQASRRSWRIKQTMNVKVFTYVYAGTIQEKALKHIARKIDASLAMQGKFSEEGLRAMSESSDGMNALAKEIMKKDLLSDVDTIYDIFTRKNQSFEEMQSVEFQEYEGYIMNPIEGGIERVREIANSLLNKSEEAFKEGKITKTDLKRARETVSNYMDIVEKFVNMDMDIKDFNKGVKKSLKAVEGQIGLDLFAL